MLIRAIVSIAVIILSAGRSSRMGASKALLPWNGRSLLAHQCVTALDADIGPVLAVLGHEIEQHTPHIPNGVRIIENTQWPSGKVSSICHALHSITGTVDGYLFLSVDQPSLPHIVRTVANHLQQHDICLAMCQGTLGHPIAFHPRMRPHLMTLNETQQGMKALIHNNQFAIHSVEINHPSILWNLNTSRDYERALQQHVQGGSC